jgi:hypothetical protein
MIEKFESDSRRRQGETQGGAIDHTLKKCTDLSIEAITDWGVESKRLNDAFNIAFIDYQKNLKLNISVIIIYVISVFNCDGKQI